MTSNKVASNADALAYAAVSGWIYANTGVPVPPLILKNATKAIGSLMTSALKIPEALIDAKLKPIVDSTSARFAISEAETRAKVQAIEDETEARSLISEAAAKAVADRFSKDEALVMRAASYHFARLLGEQENREAVMKAAVAELAAKPSTEDAPAEIEQDWLSMFARHAETKTNADMRAYFGRILAGEIRKPGTFSPATVEVLSKLTPDVAELFQNFCNISATLVNPQPFVLAEPYGAPGGNALKPLGFSFDQICWLQDAGLVRAEFAACRSFPPHLLARVPIVLCDSMPIALTLDFPLDESAQKAGAVNQNMSSLFFSRAGQELRSIVNMTPDPRYVRKFIEWAAQYNLRPAPSL